jgi:hypothetical protein
MKVKLAKLYERSENNAYRKLYSIEYISKNNKDKKSITEAFTLHNQKKSNYIVRRKKYFLK